MPLSQNDIKKYQKLYLRTAKNYLENMQASIAFLLKGEQIHAAVKQVHIDAHSLKSQSQLMGYVHIAKICEIVEYLFAREEKEHAHVSHHVLIKIQSDITRLMDSLKEIEKSGAEIDLTERIIELESFKN